MTSLPTRRDSFKVESERLETHLTWRGCQIPLDHATYTALAHLISLGPAMPGEVLIGQIQLSLASPMAVCGLSGRRVAYNEAVTEGACR